ncbi:recombinase family protein [Mesorhizobium sp. AD1-1]|nr:recombinase family protein [Mesorhizobium sp. AD1-1]
MPREWKSLSTDRVILVPGLADEIAIVRWIFSQVVNRGKAEFQIANALNERGVPAELNRTWSTTSMRNLLTNTLPRSGCLPDSADRRDPGGSRRSLRLSFVRRRRFELAAGFADAVRPGFLHHQRVAASIDVLPEPQGTWNGRQR